jgi:hypothetical protein
MERCVLDCSQFGTDDLLLDRLSELAAIVDPVPWTFQASARAAFARQSTKPIARVNPVRDQTVAAEDDPGSQISGPSNPASQ